MFICEFTVQNMLGLQNAVKSIINFNLTTFKTVQDIPVIFLKNSKHIHRGMMHLF